MSGLHVVVPGDRADDLLNALRNDHDVVVASECPPDEVLGLLVNVCRRPGVATASPIPLQGTPRPLIYDAGAVDVGPPTIPGPNPRLCVISADAVNSLAGYRATSVTAGEAVRSLGDDLLRHGWRHVGAPGVAMSPPARSTSVAPLGGWTDRAVAELAGRANLSLETHVGWARAQIDGLTVVIDGACITDSPFTGTQHLVVELSRWLAVTRPDARVVLATGRRGLTVARSLLRGSGVTVVRRRSGTKCDVLYRPYQMLFADEFDFVMRTGGRRIVGQLDMIGFDNPFYHPSDELWFFARNLQRAMMRTMDGVTFISSYGRDSALLDCPDLRRDRLHVVSCGADPNPSPGFLQPHRSWPEGRPFIGCLSSTFAHKNRSHAIATFASLALRHGYDGDLVIGGPEPYYGRSTGDEDAVLAEMEPGLRRRVHRWGHVTDDEKWWILRRADVILYPSIVEGFGLVPFEAAAAGTPCLASDTTAMRELLGATGATVRGWSPDVWADRVSAIAGSLDEATDVVREVREVASRTTWERCARLTWTAIDETVARPSTQGRDEGGTLCAVSIGHQRRQRGMSLRFQIVRGVPAARRRLQTMLRYLKMLRNLTP